jgi:small subunit ribosomal protein S7e
VAAALVDAFNSSEDAQKTARVPIVSVPSKQIAAYHTVNAYLVPELEKELGAAQAVIVAKRRAFPKPLVRGRDYRAIRATGRTLRSVQEALLDDIVYPTAILCRRTHCDPAGRQTQYVLPDAHDKTRADERIAGVGVAYTRLAGRKTVFQFGAPEMPQTQSASRSYPFTF